MADETQNPGTPGPQGEPTKPAPEPQGEPTKPASESAKVNNATGTPLASNSNATPEQPGNPAAGTKASKSSKLREGGRGAWVPKDEALKKELAALEGNPGNLSPEKLLEAKEAIWKKAGRFERIGESTAQNFSHNGIAMKAVRGGGALLGVILVGKGVIDLFSGPTVDDKGVQTEEAPSKLGALVKVAGGAALGIMSLVAGGKGRALEPRGI